MSAPLISIVIPTYKRPDMLDGLFAALLPQLAGAEDVETWVIDNDPEASAKACVEAHAATTPGLSYLHEPNPGVVNARNSGVRAAQGAYILFLDDDEIPRPGWLAAFRAYAEAGETAAFGRIAPLYEGEMEDPGLEPLLARLFSREYDKADGADLTAFHAELGTGNALFHKARCLSDDPPFDPAFNRSGGEDIFMIQKILAKGDRLNWCPDGMVDERVPANRMTEDYLAARRYNQGRLRCLLLYRQDGLRALPRIAFWMSVGAAQVALHGAKAQFSGAGQGATARAELRGGLGKLFWWRGMTRALYGGS